MKSRAEVARFVEKQLHWGWKKPAIPQRYEDGSEPSAHHYGLCELRQLLDFIYEREPLILADEIRSNPQDLDDAFRANGRFL